jgi:uncharacterized protein YdcH (DUF465 family)
MCQSGPDATEADLLKQRVQLVLDRQLLLFQHNALDQKIKNMEARLEPGTPDEVELLKKKKLAIKDELYALLQKISLSRVRT